MSPRYEVEVVRDVGIPTGQRGVSLAADVYRPLRAEPGPALVTVLPYRKDAWAGLMNGGHLRRLAARGYAALLVDLRGTGSSGGRARPPFHPDDADDGVAAVMWAAAQSWCDGSVGMWGHSYGAIMAMRTATRQPAALKAIVPVMGMIDPERDFVHPSGRRGNLSSLGVWGLHTLLTQLLPPLRAGSDPTGDAALRRRWRARRDAEPYVVDLVRHGPGDPVWRERVVDATRITVPALCIGGWQDLFCAGTVRAYEQMTGPKRLLIGPWTHTMPDDSQIHPADFVALAGPWWDRWLRGVDNGIDTGPSTVLYVPSVGWREYDSWPPAKTTQMYATDPRSKRLVSMPAAPTAGRTTRRPYRSALIAEHRGDPTAGALGALWAVPSAGLAQPLDQHDDDMRSLIVTSDPLPCDVLVIGAPTVTIFGSAVSFVVKLTDVDPCGRSVLVTCGDATSSSGPVHLTPVCHAFTAGHRIRVALNQGDFPRLWPTSGRDVLRVSGVELTLPTMAAADGAPVVIAPPAAAADSGDGEPGVRWIVTRDFVNDSLEVRLAESLTARFETGTLRVMRDVNAATSPIVLRGVSSATNDRFAIAGSIELSEHGLRVTGTATKDGRAVWSRIWSIGQPRP